MNLMMRFVSGCCDLYQSIRSFWDGSTARHFSHFSIDTRPDFSYSPNPPNHSTSVPGFPEGVTVVLATSVSFRVGPALLVGHTSNDPSVPRAHTVPLLVWPVGRIVGPLV